MPLTHSVTKQETWWRRSTSAMQKYYPLGCTEGRKRGIRWKATKLVLVVFSLSFVVELHYKLNFPFHCAIQKTKVQQLRIKNHRLEEGDCIWQGGTNFSSQSCLVGPNLAAKSGLGRPLLAAKSFPGPFSVYFLAWQHETSHFQMSCWYSKSGTNNITCKTVWTCI